MGKKLAMPGHPTRGKEVIELLEMLGGKDVYDSKCINPYRFYYILDGYICWDSLDYNGYEEIDKYNIFTLEEFLKTFPFKVGDKIFLYDNITEGCVTGMEWDENKGTVKYCVYTSAEYWCDVKELLKWNPIDFLEDKHCNEKQVNGMKNVLAELLEHIKTTPKEELEREFEEIKEWSNVGPTIEEFITFCECVNKKPPYPKTYNECYNILNCFSFTDVEQYNFENDWRLTIKDKNYGNIMNAFVKLLICRDTYWKIAGEELGLNKPWEPKFGKYIHYSIKFYLYQDSFVLHKGEYSSSDNCILVFPTEEMRDVFYENFKDLIEQCKELL